MSICPVCENEQAAGDACDVCGRPFSSGGSGGASVEPLAGLEPTLFEAADAAGEPIPDMEPTGFASGPAAPVTALEIDETRVAPVDVTVDAMAELEPTLAEPVPEDASAGSAGPVCRYCRTPAAPTDTFCYRCGMRLSTASPGARGDGVAAPPCRSCGTPAPGEACPGCGARTAR